MIHTQQMFDGEFEATVAKALALLRENVPPEGYYLAFSGGKDSCVIKHLAQTAGVTFDAWYNQTTMDPPELMKFIREKHADVGWNRPALPMMHRVAAAPKIPPTRQGRWCCSEYKEVGGDSRVKLFGVRAAESPRRKKNWSEVTVDMHGDKALCPIVFWDNEMVWRYIRHFKVPYCSLYDEGFTRLGCVGCPLASKDNQDAEFKRWPGFERAWKQAVVASWEKWHDVPNSKTGAPRYHAKFSSGEAFWQWWRNYRAPDLLRGDCQPGILWTNEAGADEDELNREEV